MQRRMSRRQRQILQQGATIRFAHIGSHSVHKSIHFTLCVLLLFFCQFSRKKRPHALDTHFWSAMPSHSCTDTDGWLLYFSLSSTSRHQELISQKTPRQRHNTSQKHTVYLFQWELHHLTSRRRQHKWRAKHTTNTFGRHNKPIQFTTANVDRA